MNYVVWFVVIILSTKNGTGNTTHEDLHILVHGASVQTSVRLIRKTMICPVFYSSAHLLQQMDTDGWVHGQCQQERNWQMQKLKQQCGETCLWVFLSQFFDEKGMVFHSTLCNKIALSEEQECLFCRKWGLLYRTRQITATCVHV